MMRDHNVRITNLDFEPVIRAKSVTVLLYLDHLNEMIKVVSRTINGFIFSMIVSLLVVKGETQRKRLSDVLFEFLSRRYKIFCFKT